MMQLIRTWWAFSVAPLCFGGGGGSSSQATTSTTTNTDNRQVVSDNGVGLSNVSNSHITVQHTDAGAMKTASDMFRMANDASSTNYDKLLSTTSGGLSSLIDFGKVAMQGAFGSAQAAQSNAKAMMDVGQSKGTLDNKTIAILGVAMLAAVGLFAFKK